MQSEENRSKLMVASYMGGAAIATTYVGLVHPFSAGLSVVFGLHHCVSNCMTMRAMEEFYPDEYNDFWNMVKIQKIKVPRLHGDILKTDPNDQTYEQLFNSTIIHEKPLTNALGSNFRKILTPEKVHEMFKMI
jgi:3-deoxy-alpha-D-manno-octulosonate 8-oxidase